MSDKLYSKCPFPIEKGGNHQACPLCKGVGFIEAGITNRQIEKLMRDYRSLRAALERFNPLIELTEETWRVRKKTLDEAPLV